MSTISNLLPAPPDNFSTTLNGSITTGSLAIVLNSVSGLGSEGVGVTYAKDSEGEVVADSVEFVHWTSVVGSTLNLTDSGDRGITGSANGAQTHSSGDTFEVWVHSAYQSGPRTAFLAQHNDNGSLKANAVTTLSITDGSVTSAKLAANTAITPRSGGVLPTGVLTLQVATVTISVTAGTSVAQTTSWPVAFTTFVTAWAEIQSNDTNNGTFINTTQGSNTTTARAVAYNVTGSTNGITVHIFGLGVL